MLWIEALHVIAVIAWFAGLFYLPRLFVYHAGAKDIIGIERFKVMEHKLYYYIMSPAALLSGIFGLILLLHRHEYYSHQMWMHVKLIAVMVLVAFHLYCGHLLKVFKQDRNKHSEKFYRYLNEFPTIILFIVIIMVIVKPQF